MAQLHCQACGHYWRGPGWPKPLPNCPRCYAPGIPNVDRWNIPQQRQARRKKEGRVDVKQSLQDAWREYNKVRAEGHKFYIKGNRLLDKGAEVEEVHKLWAKGHKLYVKAYKRWAKDVVRKVYGDVTMSWEWQKRKKAYACRLSTGEVFEP